jgi:hypothetical protein
MQKLQKFHFVNASSKHIIYWITTVIVVLENIAGSIQDLARLPTVKEVIDHLGYPEYLLFILGIWKALGALAVIIPGFPRLKEWAYAGMFFQFSGAIASHIIVHDKAVVLVVPFVLMLFVLTSWLFRPVSRRI